jgi:hypothetical protein
MLYYVIIYDVQNCLVLTAIFYLMKTLCNAIKLGLTTLTLYVFCVDIWRFEGIARSVERLFTVRGQSYLSRLPKY